jgi:hypothetical protein
MAAINRRIDAGSLAHSAQEGSPEGSPGRNFRDFPCDFVRGATPTGGAFSLGFFRFQTLSDQRIRSDCGLSRYASRKILSRLSR